MRLAPLAVLATLAAAPSLAAGWGSERGDGQVTTERRDVGGAFDAISLRGSIDARVQVGPAASVSVTIDQNLQRHVTTRLEGRTLVVEQERDVRPSEGAVVEVALPELRSFATSGSGDARIEGGKGGALSLSTAGSGDVEWRGEATALSVATRGSGNVTLAGRAASLAAATSGSGDVEASGLAVRDAEASTSGSGDVSLTIEGGTLRARTSGSGDVTYAGSADVDARASGSGRVRAR
jgi:hypothetical protein